MWFIQCNGVSLVEEGHKKWERFTNDFIDRFCPLEIREAKMLEFINISQGSMSVKEYSRVFTRFSSYSPSLVSNHRMKMYKFMMGRFDLIVKERCIVILKDDMNIDCFVFHAQLFERGELQERSKVTKMYRIGNAISLNNDFVVKSSSKIPPNFYKKKGVEPQVSRRQ